jgi:integrase
MKQTLVFKTRPEAKVIVKQHKRGCAYPVTHKEKDCKCPKYFYVTPGSHRVPAETASWEMARQRVPKWVNDHDPSIDRTTSIPVIERTVAAAFAEMVEHKKASKIGSSKSRVGKFATLGKQMVAFLAEYNAEHPKELITYAHQITTQFLDKFQGSWKGHTQGTYEKEGEIFTGMSRGTCKNRIGDIQAFFDFCLVRNYLRDTGKIRVVRGRARPKDNPGYNLTVSGLCPVINHEPLSDELEQGVFDACDRYDAAIKTRNRDEVDGDGYKLKMLCRFMSAGGFAITDAVIYPRASLGATEYVRLKTHKKGILAIDPGLLDELRAMPNDNPKYLFWSGNGEKADAAKLWHKKFQRLWKLVDPELLKTLEGDPDPHCFRNTLARRMFEKGANEADVAKALGDTEAVIRKHYSKMCEGIRSRVTGFIRMTHASNRAEVIPLKNADAVTVASAGQA